MSTFEFTTTVTPSLNLWQRISRFQKPKMRAKFGSECLAHRPLSWPSPPPAFVAVTIVRCGKKLLDTDNLYGGVKPLLDSLRDVGLIADDSPAHIELTVKQEVTPGQPHTRVALAVKETVA